VHPYQLFEASTVGSDAVLLIARLLGDRLRYFMKLAEDLGMESLVEVFSPEDVRQALNAGARLVGINNRDLETLEVDVSRTERLAGLIPDDVTLVSESGISTVEDVRRVMAAGADAVLVGTSIMRVANVEEKVRELVGALR
jgi:indole-3-glycerol phosphate synthase